MVFIVMVNNMKIEIKNNRVEISLTNIEAWHIANVDSENYPAAKTTLSKLIRLLKEEIQKDED